MRIHREDHKFSQLPGSHARALKGHEASKASLGSSIQNQQAYVDMGKFYGTNVLTQCMDWQTSPASISEEKLQSGFFGAYFAHLKQEGVNKLDLAFAQLSSITSLLNGTGQQASQSDKLATMFNPSYPVKDSSGKDLAPNFLSYMVSVAHENGIKVDISFGGAAGKDGDFKLPKSGSDSAHDLSTFMKNSGIDSVDFDIENSSLFEQNSKEDLSSFFSTLHSDLKSAGKESTLTVEGGVLQDSNYEPLLENFNQNFDSVNLMLYSNTQYTLNPDNNRIWPGVKSWIEKVGDPSKIHIGFYDSIPYESPSANQDGGSFSIKPNSSRGSAAAQIYQQMISQLNLPPGQSLGEPFFWNDNPGDDSSEKVMQDFYNTLNGISKNPWQ